MSFENLVNYLLYVVPGFISVAIYRSFYPAKKDSDFARLAWSIVYGILIYAVADWLIQHFYWSLELNPNRFPSVGALGLLFTLAIIAGYFRVLWQASRFAVVKQCRWLRFLRPARRTVWAEVNSEEPTEWAVVKLKDGSRYMGYISNWTFDPDATEHEFILSEARRVDDDFNPLYEIQGRGVYMRTSAVDHIEFWLGA